MPARIVVVDDNRTNLDLMLYLLKAFGHEAIGAPDGLSGFDAVREQSPDLVLCDILMPGIDGYEFARRYKSKPRLRRHPLVAVTALAMVGDRERVLEAGFDGYISKPIDPQTFITQVDSFLPEELRSTANSARLAVPASRAKETRAGPVILAVDDIQVNLDVIGGALRPFGYRVLEAHSGNEAIEKLRDVVPELILCDIHMPNGNGLDFIQEVKADPRLCNVPFLFLSSTAWLTTDKNRGLALGATKFLLRPIDPRVLLDEVEALLPKGQRGEDPHPRR